MSCLSGAQFGVFLVLIGYLSGAHFVSYSILVLTSILILILISCYAVLVNDPHTGKNSVVEYDMPMPAHERFGMTRREAAKLARERATEYLLREDSSC